MVHNHYDIIKFEAGEFKGLTGVILHYEVNQGTDWYNTFAWLQFQVTDMTPEAIKVQAAPLESYEAMDTDRIRIGSVVNTPVYETPDEDEGHSPTKIGEVPVDQHGLYVSPTHPYNCHTARYREDSHLGTTQVMSFKSDGEPFSAYPPAAIDPRHFQPGQIITEPLVKYGSLPATCYTGTKALVISVRPPMPAFGHWSKGGVDFIVLEEHPENDHDEYGKVGWVAGIKNPHPTSKQFGTGNKLAVIGFDPEMGELLNPKRFKAGDKVNYKGKTATVKSYDPPTVCAHGFQASDESQASFDNGKVVLQMEEGKTRKVTIRHPVDPKRNAINEPKKEA